MLRDSQICAYVPVSDVTSGREFYEGVLQQQPRLTSDAGVLYECANHSTFFMYLSDGAGSSQASCAFWSVEDVGKEVAQLKERGVKFEHYDLPGMSWDGDVATGGDSQAAWFKDPDGNTLAIIEQIDESADASSRS